MNRRREFEYEFEFNSQMNQSWALFKFCIHVVLCAWYAFFPSSQESLSLCLSSSSINYKHLKSCHSLGCKRWMHHRSNRLNTIFFNRWVWWVPQVLLFCACNWKYLMAISIGNLWISFLLSFADIRCAFAGTFICYSMTFFSHQKGNISKFESGRIAGNAWHSVIEIQCIELTIHPTSQSDS